ncbi:putative deaminase [Hyphodiscus hymeniophilus]|uniref:Deaminase n=1 Tax=Hyphodiscus hymeniophilus TaxID=353542 RepID=A0A9P7AYU4_9HELO|nr:putative deaminase [Hyphodiscus hymeniophilus]
MGPIRYEILQEWKQQVNNLDDRFIAGIPKVELHIHIEGTLTPELRFRLGQRNSIPLHSKRLNKTFTSLEELKEMYNLLQPRSIKGANQVSAFFDAYYGGMEVLRMEDDFYELAMDYFDKAAKMNVRYCEPFFDPQAHTRRGVHFGTFMEGFKRAQLDAERDLNVKSQWIMCMLRDMPPESAMEHYEAALLYKEMIVGIGLDSNEYDRPPSLFEPLYLRARGDGFKLTCHCDVTQKDTHEHIRQVAESVGGTGADRLDHGLDAAERPELVALIKNNGIGVTLCPWAYVRHHKEEDLFGHVRTIFDAGIKVNVSSDSPAYVESNWITQNLGLLRVKAGFTDAEIARVERDSVDMCWAAEEVKREILDEIERFHSSIARIT